MKCPFCVCDGDIHLFKENGRLFYICGECDSVIDSPERLG